MLCFQKLACQPPCYPGRALPAGQEFVERERRSDPVVFPKAATVFAPRRTKIYLVCVLFSGTDEDIV